MPLRGHEIEIGPLAGVMTRRTSEGDELLEADLHLPGDGRISLEARRGAAGMRARLHADGIGPAAIPAELVPISIAEGALSFDVRAEGPNDLSRLAAHGRLTLDRVVSKDERLSPDPVGPLFLEAAGDLDLDVASRRVSLRSAGIRLQRAVTIAVEGEARLVPRVPFALALHTDGTDFGAAMAALPAALAPPPDVPRPAGPLSFRLDVAGPLAAPAEWTLEATLDLGLLRESARRGSPPGLRGAFTYRPEGENGPSVVVGPSNPDFVPLAELPEHLVRAVTTSEDAGFFGHSGFDFDEIRNALAQAQEAGRWVRGGSTITQQLAKNLFLSREKTLARKIREAFSTIALEATVPKPRLLEIYLNVAEWGPGIHGIGRAARHWFGKDARALTPKEAAFLASVIPNPVRYHVMFAKGEVPNFWEERVEGILFKMTEQGVLTGDQLLQALEEPIVFAHG